MIKLLAVMVLLLLSGCAGLGQSLSRWNNGGLDPEVAEQRRREEQHLRMLNRVVYTPLIPSRKPTDPSVMEVLLRPPAVAYKELGLISMYRENSNETAAMLLPIVKERAAQEGAEAILLMEVAEKPVGSQSATSAVPIGDVIFAHSYNTLITEGTIRGIAIFYLK